jgi:hypothetical protein
MSNTVYPHRVDYPRTPNWWGGLGVEGDWSKISSWCDEIIGKGEWEYYGGTFVFCTESSLMLFKLKWL